MDSQPETPTSSATPSRNIVLKARDPHGTRSLQICRELGAIDHGKLRQRDTYFTVAAGRLKLREKSPGTAELIQYDRADRPEQRESRYHVAPVQDPGAMLMALTAALGVRVVVVKRRHFFMQGPVRIHLDQVDGLGQFIEFEAVAPPTSDLSLERRLVSNLRGAFATKDDHLCSTGYADQILLA